MSKNQCVNKVMLLGVVIREPRWHTFEGERWLHFAVVTAEATRSAKGAITHEEVHNIRISEKTPFANMVSIKKGDTVYIQGKVQTTVLTDADGIKRYRADIISSSVEVIAHFGATVV